MSSGNQSSPPRLQSKQELGHEIINIAATQTKDPRATDSCGREKEEEEEEEEERFMQRRRRRRRKG